MRKTILRNIPVPTISNKPNGKYDFHLIKEGESCLYEGTHKELINVRAASIEYSKRHKLKFITRTTDDGLMVWHLKKDAIQAQKQHQPWAIQ